MSMNEIFEQFSNQLKVEEEFYPNGQKKSERWFLDYLYHKENDPSYQSWYENGQKKDEYWYLNGKSHREDGPSFQSWSENGQKQYVHWYLNGKKYTRKKWIKKLKKIGSPHYEEQKMLYTQEKYNI